MAPSSFDQGAFIDHQEWLLGLEMNEEFEQNVKYAKWPIATMVHRKVAVVGLNYFSSQFISHGCREVVFSIPFAPGRPRRGKQMQRIKVRDTLRVQDFVTIRRKEKVDATMFLETMAVSPAIVSMITKTEITVRLKEDAESTYNMEEFMNVIIVKHVIDDTTHRRIKLALTSLQLGTCPDISQEIRDLIFAPDDEGLDSRTRSKNGGKSADFLSKWFDSITLRDEAIVGMDENRNKVKVLSDNYQNGNAPVKQGELILPGPVDFINRQLDSSQKGAVEFALKQPTLAIIHGPPGTGKTTTLVEIIHQLVLRYRMRVLVCGPSNVSVDNLLKKLVEMRILRTDCMIRMGNPTRVFDDELMKYTMDGQLDQADTNGILSRLRMMLEQEPTFQRKRRIAAALKMEKRRQAKPLLEKANIILSTLASACPEETLLSTIIGRHDDSKGSNSDLKREKSLYFDVVIVDECGQATEMATYIPLWLGKKVILAGDHLQLPPTVLSREANSHGMGISLMQRLLETMRGQKLTKMLTVQYRMNRLIMNLISGLLYENRLSAHPSISEHLLKTLYPKLRPHEFPAISYMNTYGQANGHEDRASLTQSVCNELEACLIVNYAKEMIRGKGIHWENIGIITPYQEQIRVIQKKLAKNRETDKIEVNTVDGFQGREKEVILISFVRSNDQGSVGFLREKRRLNVAITRARRHVLFVGNFGTLTHDDFIHSLFENIQGDGNLINCSKYRDIEKPEKIVTMRRDVVAA